MDASLLLHGDEDTDLHGSNCIFDGTSEFHGKSLIQINFFSSEEIVDSGANTPVVTSDGPMRGVTELGFCKWVVPISIILLSVVSMFMGMACFTHQIDLFPYCGVAFSSSSVVLPILCIIIVILTAQPSSRYMQQEDFFSDALLEEMLSGENILDVYTVATNGMMSGNVVVFLSGVGGISETWREQVESVIQAGFSVITIQLPGSGVLSAVRFSLARAEKVVRRVLDIEVFKLESDSLSDGECSPRGPGLEFDRKVVLVSWGISTHVALYLASNQRLGNEKIAGLVIFGSPHLPTVSFSWSLYFNCMSFRVHWIREMARFIERAYMHSETRHAIPAESLNPEARADWYNSFMVRKEALRVACAEYVGPVLCVSGNQKYLEDFKTYFQNSPSGVVERVYLRKTINAGLSSFPYRHGSLLSSEIVDFANSVYL